MTTTSARARFDHDDWWFCATCDGQVTDRDNRVVRPQNEEVIHERCLPAPSDVSATVHIDGNSYELS